MGERWPIICAPMYGHFVKRPAVSFQAIRDVVSHHRTIIAHSVFYHQINDFLCDIVDWCTVATRLFPTNAYMRIERTLEPLALHAPCLDRILMQVAMMAYLVTIF